MSNAITDQQKIQQLTEAYEAFGADTSKWPDNRDTYLSQFAEHPDVQMAKKEALWLDQQFASSASPGIPAHLVHQIQADIDRKEQSLNLVTQLKRWAGQWRLNSIGLVGVVACSAVLGVTVSLLTAPDFSPEEEFLFYTYNAIESVL